MPETTPTLETPESLRRKRLRFRCWRRGSREADLLLGRFADRHLETMDATALDRLDALLNESDPDLWDWVVRGAEAPATIDQTLITQLRALAGTLDRR